MPLSSIINIIIVNFHLSEEFTFFFSRYIDVHWEINFGYNLGIE